MIYVYLYLYKILAPIVRRRHYCAQVDILQNLKVETISTGRFHVFRTQKCSSYSYNHIFCPCTFQESFRNPDCSGNLCPCWTTRASHKILGCSHRSCRRCTTFSLCSPSRLSTPRFPLKFTDARLTLALVAKSLVAVVVLAISSGVTLPLAFVVLARAVLVFALFHSCTFGGLIALPSTGGTGIGVTKAVLWVVPALAIFVGGALTISDKGFQSAVDYTLSKIADTACISDILAARNLLTIRCKTALVITLSLD